MMKCEGMPDYRASPSTTHTSPAFCRCSWPVAQNPPSVSKVKWGGKGPLATDIEAGERGVRILAEKSNVEVSKSPRPNQSSLNSNPKEISYREANVITEYSPRKTQVEERQKDAPNTA